MTAVDPKLRLIKNDEPEELEIPNIKKEEDLLGDQIYSTLEITEEDIINIHGELPQSDLVIVEEEDDDDD